MYPANHQHMVVRQDCAPESIASRTAGSRKQIRIENQGRCWKALVLAAFLAYAALLAFLITSAGISQDNACGFLGSFCRLPLSRIKAAEVLRQVALHVAIVFDPLSSVLAQ